jgi:predicted  nucleic acid-binding Zn-ribbon protein
LKPLKKKKKKSLKDLQENKTKQENELNKTMQDLKMEIETRNHQGQQHWKFKKT